MNKHIYYRLELELKSPMAIGTGYGKYTDDEVIRNSKGNPFIPGTSLAGIYRRAFGEEDTNNYFGINSDVGKLDDTKNRSLIKVYDGNLEKNCKYNVSVRDGVALDEYKTSKEGAKFDFEVVETGAKFITYIEICKNELGDAKDVIEKILKALNSGDIMIGSKTSRGYGRVSVIYKKKEFEFPKEIESWLEFDMFDDDKWEELEALQIESKSEKEDVINIKLKQIGGISIRKYVTDQYVESNQIPDYEQLTLENDSKGIPVIPGTSWAGAFRHRFSEILCDLGLSKKVSENDFFGCGENDSVSSSKIKFSESILSGGEFKIITRNSIDRFSGGTKDGALYTEKTYFGGDCELEIRLPKDDLYKIYRQVIGVCIKDLENGLLSIGGLTAIGRGTFEVENIMINGEIVEGDILDVL